ncbi:hypothetical protein [Providencia stuartii]|uniref:hypothetical protein n=1 Tax=Providencia stuartii TaxID=588 RepID=UPI000A3F6DD8
MLLTLLNEFRTSKNSKTRKLKMLYRLILNHGPVRAEELSSLASMKPATCARLLDELSKSQLISTSELGESTGDASQYCIVSTRMMGMLLGLR